MALTAGRRRATLATDKVVCPINLAGTTGALAAGQWIHNDGVMLRLFGIQGEISVKKEKVWDYRNCSASKRWNIHYIMVRCFGRHAFLAGFLP